MKLLLSIIAAVALIGCAEKVEYPADARVIAIEGMGCGNCESAVELAVFRVEGVRWAQADKDRNEVQIKLDQGILLEQIILDIQEAVNTTRCGPDTFIMGELIR
jgi:copper chaperone CopZ